MKPCLLDTDTLSAFMRGDPNVVETATAYLMEHGTLVISAVTKYEVLRGLEAKQATRQTERFHTLCTTLDVLPISDEVLLHGAVIYGDLHRRGQLIGDADILIAATAMVDGRAIVTNNVAHFDRIEDLSVTNWLAGLG